MEQPTTVISNPTRDIVFISRPAHVTIETAGLTFTLTIKNGVLELAGDTALLLEPLATNKVRIRQGA